MSKIKYTKTELKKQKDSLKRFLRYLPTLQLKKQQLQMELRKIDEALKANQGEYDLIFSEMLQWIDVLGEEVGLENFIQLKNVITEQSNIAGVDIPIFKEAVFDTPEYDLFVTPLWVDRSLKSIKSLIQKKIEAKILKEQFILIQQELTVTSQRVNLFEKIKIPQTRKDIRTIQIFLGDSQTAAVVRGKISKKKIMEKQLKESA